MDNLNGSLALRVWRPSILTPLPTPFPTSLSLGSSYCPTMLSSHVNDSVLHDANNTI